MHQEGASGTGSFATVWQVEDVKDKKEWAVKVIDKSKCSKEELKDILWEAEALKIVRHDYVTEMKEFIDGEHFIYIVMEIMRGGELFDRIVERGFLLRGHGPRCSPHHVHWARSLS